MFKENECIQSNLNLNYSDWDTNQKVTLAILHSGVKCLFNTKALTFLTTTKRDSHIHMTERCVVGKGGHNRQKCFIYLFHVSEHVIILKQEHF